MILNRQRAVRVARRPLEVFSHRVLLGLDLRDSDVTICLVSDAEIARMNEAFRKKKGPTDVLSFPAGKKRPASGRGRNRINTDGAEDTESTEKSRGKRESRTAETYLGDIAIAPQTAQRYAKKNGRS